MNFYINSLQSNVESYSKYKLFRISEDLTHKIQHKCSNVDIIQMLKKYDAIIEQKVHLDPILSQSSQFTSL